MWVPGFGTVGTEWVPSWNHIIKVVPKWVPRGIYIINVGSKWDQDWQEWVIGLVGVGTKWVPVAGEWVPGAGKWVPRWYQVCSEGRVDTKWVLNRHQGESGYKDWEELVPSVGTRIDRIWYFWWVFYGYSSRHN